MSEGASPNAQPFLRLFTAHTIFRRQRVPITLKFMEAPFTNDSGQLVVALSLSTFVGSLDLYLTANTNCRGAYTLRHIGICVEIEQPVETEPEELLVNIEC